MFNKRVMKHEISTSGSASFLVSNVIVCKDGKSPFWVGQWRDGRGRRVRRSTKVPVRGGVYFYTLCGRLKNFIDRTLPLYPYEGFAGKKWQLIISAAEDEKENMQHAVGDFMGFMECMEEPVIAEPVYGIGAWQVGDIKNKTEVIQQAHAAGTRA